MELRASELRAKDVINTTDGRRLGNIYDLQLDLERGCIRAVLLPGGGSRGLWFLNRERDVEIPWDRIVRIGVDVILVELPAVVEIRGGIGPA